MKTYVFINDKNKNLEAIKLIIYTNDKIECTLVGDIYSLIIYIVNNKKTEEKRNNKNKEREYTFYFYEKYIKIKYRRRFERLTYFQIYKIFETSEHFFLYLDEKSSLILNKKGFEIGTPKEFSKFIKRKCPFKYKEEKNK